MRLVLSSNPVHLFYTPPENPLMNDSSGSAAGSAAEREPVAGQLTGSV